MAYENAELEELAIKAIKKHKIAKVSYLIPYLPISQKTFYNHELHELQSIKDALYKNRIERKQKLISKWEESDNATLSIAAFKLLADDEELERLSVERKSGEENKPPVVIENRKKSLDDITNDN